MLLYGIGNILVCCVLEQIGFEQVYVVVEQEQLDVEFFIVKFFNLEEWEVFIFVMKLGEFVGVDILIGIDLDVDCMGVVVKDNDGKYFVLFGN